MNTEFEKELENATAYAEKIVQSISEPARQQKSSPEELGQAVMQLKRGGFLLKEIAEITKVSERTLQRWIAAYRKKESQK